LYIHKYLLSALSTNVYLLFRKHLVREPPNGMAQRQRRGCQDTFTIIAHFLQADAYPQRRSRCPLEPVLDIYIEGFFPKVINSTGAPL
jgi:hypothetical protein